MPSQRQKLRFRRTSSACASAYSWAVRRLPAHASALDSIRLSQATRRLRAWAFMAESLAQAIASAGHADETAGDGRQVTFSRDAPASAQRLRSPAHRLVVSAPMAAPFERRSNLGYGWIF